MRPHISPCPLPSTPAPQTAHVHSINWVGGMPAGEVTPLEPLESGRAPVTPLLLTKDAGSGQELITKHSQTAFSAPPGSLVHPGTKGRVRPGGSDVPLHKLPSSLRSHKSYCTDKVLQGRGEQAQSASAMYLLASGATCKLTAGSVWLWFCL